MFTKLYLEQTGKKRYSCQVNRLLHIEICWHYGQRSWGAEVTSKGRLLNSELNIKFFGHNTKDESIVEVIYALRSKGYVVGNFYKFGKEWDTKFITGVTKNPNPTVAPKSYFVSIDTESLDKDVIYHVEQITKEVDVCECGKDKHGFASHSTWCKLWRSNYEV